MLAWLHQATASEREHLEALLKHVTQQGATSFWSCAFNSIDFYKFLLFYCLGSNSSNSNNEDSYDVTNILYFFKFSIKKMLINSRLEWPWYFLVKKNSSRLLSDYIYLCVFIFGWLWHEHDLSLCDDIADTWLQTARPRKQRFQYWWKSTRRNEDWCISLLF